MKKRLVLIFVTLLSLGVNAAYSKSLFQAHHLFFDDVAKGKQYEAKIILETAEDKQALLKMVDEFSDYSNRTFYSTAYEYAYWAKDTHMRRMLEAYMDDKTKSYLLERIENIDKNGLTYWVFGKKIEGSKQFDFKTLIKALAYYKDNIQKWDDDNDLQAMNDAWMAVGIAERDVPAHVAQEYCREDRSFEFIDEFTFHEQFLPRTFLFVNFTDSPVNFWFPVLSPDSGLGYHFAVVRAYRSEAAGARWTSLEHVSMDYTAMIRLDEVRTDDLVQSRKNLKITSTICTNPRRDCP